ncbi:unnamed protein product [Pylaiella littoralis]
MRFNSAYYAAAAAAATAGVGCAAFGVGPQQQQPQFRSPRLVAQRAASFRGQVTGLRCENPSRRTAAAASGLRGAAGQGHGEALLCRHQSKNGGGGGVGGHFRRLRRRRGCRPLFHGSTGSSTGSSTSGGGGGGSHGHDDHNHGPAQDGLLGLNPDNKNGAAGGDPGRLAAAAGAGAAVVAATAAAGETSSPSHGGHSHGGGMGHSHAHFHVDVASLKTRPALIRLFLATMCVLAVPLWRRSSRLEWAALGGVSMFLAAVDVSKFAISKLRVQVGQLYSGWKAHSDLATSSQQDKSGQSMDAAREVDAITWIGALVNVGLAGFKFFAGIMGHSSAMIADAGHSLSDLLSDAVTLWAVRLSRLPPDDDHPYGHGRFEAVGAFIIALILMGAGYGIGNHSFETLRDVMNGGGDAVTPSKLTALAASISIVAKEVLFRATNAVGKRRNSQVLIANAWHHRTDAVSSVVALLAVLGSMCGAPMLDPIAGLMVAGMVALTGVQVSTDAMAQLTDHADYDVRRKVAEMATQVPGVVSFDRVRARRMGPQTLVDLTIQTDNMISASAAQQVGQRVRWKILGELPFVADVMVNIAVESKPCPAMSSLRPQEDIEQASCLDIRDVVLSKLPEIESVPKIMVHYINMVTTAELFIRVDPNLKIRDAADIARRAKKALSSNVHDLCSTEIHLGKQHYGGAEVRMGCVCCFCCCSSCCCFYFCWCSTSTCCCWEGLGCRRRNDR